MAEIDKQHGKNKDGKIEYATIPLMVDGKIVSHHPTRGVYLRYGFKDIIDNVPPKEPGYKIIIEGLEENDFQIIVRYKYMPDDGEPGPEVHTYRRSYIAQWIRQNGKWDEFTALLEQSDDLGFMWDTSTEFDSNHPMWNQALADVKLALELSDAQIENMLRYGETGKY